MKTPNFFMKKCCCLLAFLALAFFSMSAWSENEKLPVYGELPDLEFVDQNSQSQNIKSTRGGILLLNFFFTSCQGICPNIMGKLARVQKTFDGQESLRLISLSVDPEVDQVEQLKAYEQKLKANQGQQSWLLGRLDQKKLLEFLRGGAKLAGDPDPNSHSTRVVLVDPKGQIRSYFNGLEPDLYDRIVPAVQQLLADLPATK